MAIHATNIGPHEPDGVQHCTTRLMLLLKQSTVGADKKLGQTDPMDWFVPAKLGLHGP